MRIGIIGLGWLGAPLGELLNSKGFAIVGTTRSQEKAKRFRELGIQVEHFEQNDFFGQIDWILELDYLILAVPPSTFKEEYPCAMINCAKQINEKAKVVFISSTSVYSNQLTFCNEETVANGEERSAPFIINAEMQLKNLLGKRITIIRMGGLIGGNRHPANFMQGREIQNGDSPINVIHLDDCIGLIEWVLKNDFFGEIINGVSAEHPKKSEFYTWAADKLELQRPVFRNGGAEFKTVQSKWRNTNSFYQYKFDDPYEYPINEN